MRPLTERQWRVLDFIREAIASKGYPPTMREIGVHIGIGLQSTARVTDYLRALEGKGYIVADPVVSRGIRVICDFAPRVRVSGCGERFVFVAPRVSAGGAVFFPPTPSLSTEGA